MSGLTRYDTGTSFICLMGRALLERGHDLGARYHRGCDQWLGRPHRDCIGVVVRTKCACDCHRAALADANKDQEVTG